LLLQLAQQQLQQLAAVDSDRPDGQVAVVAAPHQVQQLQGQRPGLPVGSGHTLAVGWAQPWPVACSRLVVVALLALRPALAAEHHRKALGMHHTAVVLVAGRAPRRRPAALAVPCDGHTDMVPFPAEVALVAHRALVAALGTSLASWDHTVADHTYAAEVVEIPAASLVVAHLEVHVEDNPTVVGVPGNTLAVVRQQRQAGHLVVEAQQAAEIRLVAHASLHLAVAHLVLAAESAS